MRKHTAPYIGGCEFPYIVYFVENVAEGMHNGLKP